MNAAQLILDIKNRFAAYANFSGWFGPRGYPASYAVIQFGTNSIVNGAVIPIDSIFVVATGGPLPTVPAGAMIPLHVSVTVIETSNASFKFSTDPGHVLHPATITFTALDLGQQTLYFHIDVSGDFANLLTNALFYLGGSDLESKIWNHFNTQVAAACAK